MFVLLICIFLNCSLRHRNTFKEENYEIICIQDYLAVWDHNNNKISFITDSIGELINCENRK